MSLPIAPGPPLTTNRSNPVTSPPAQVNQSRRLNAGGGLLSPPTAGLDIQGDGSLIGFSGGIARKKFPADDRDEIFDSIRKALGDG